MFKKVLIISVSFLILIPALAIARVTLTVEDSQGYLSSLNNPVEVSLDNPEDKIKSIQVDVCDVDDYLIPRINACEITDRTSDFICLYNELENGCVRVTLFSLSGELIDEGYGPVFILNYDIFAEAPRGGCTDLNPENAEVSDNKSGKVIKVDTYSGEFCLFGCGDVYPREQLPDKPVCGDGVVDILDMLVEIDIVLGLIEPSECQKQRADVPTGTLPHCSGPDDYIDVLDILVIIDMALGKPDCCDYYYFGKIY